MTTTDESQITTQQVDEALNSLIGSMTWVRGKDLPGFLNLDGIRHTTEPETVNFRGDTEPARRFYFREAVVDRLLDLRLESATSEESKELAEV